jgi:hypothetical protein
MPLEASTRPRRGCWPRGNRLGSFASLAGGPVPIDLNGMPRRVGGSGCVPYREPARGTGGTEHKGRVTSAEKRKSGPLSAGNRLLIKPMS